MINDDEKPDATESAPEAKPRFTPLVLVSMLLGFLLGLGCVFAYVGYEKNRVLKAQVAAAREEVKKKNAAIEDMQAQIEALSRQIGSLKDYSVARSRPNGGGKAPQEKTSGNEASVPVAAPLPTEKPKDLVRENAQRPAGSAGKAVPVKEAKPKDDVQNCDLVGKSPDEQAATLKRCVTAMDGIAEKPASGTGAGRRR